MKSKKLGRTIFGLVMLAIMLTLGFIMESGILKTDNEYWVVFTLLMAVCIVGLPIAVIMARKSILEAEEKRVKKMIDKHNEDKHDEK